LEPANLVSRNPVEGVDVLITVGNYSQGELEELTERIEKEQCSTPCSIEVWDDEVAYDVDVKGNEIPGLQDYLAWEEENYVFVADHLVAYKPYDQNSVYIYSLKDSRYDELLEE